MRASCTWNRTWQRTVLGFLAAISFGFIAANSAFALPSRQEIYRSDKLKIIVYKDNNEDGVLDFLPPVKFMQDDAGKAVIYPMNRPDGGVDYTFYVVPYMSDEIMELLRGEIAGFTKVRQLRPITVTQLGVKIDQFNYSYVGDKITDEQYLNMPQPVKLTVPAADVTAFQFFLSNPPGIQVRILMSFDAEKMDKYTEFTLSHKEVYAAVTQGLAGKYQYSRAEISSALTDYISKKDFEMKSKGDIALPDVINRAIDECFTPVPNVDPRRRRPGYPSYPTYDPYYGGGGGTSGIPYYLAPKIDAAVGSGSPGVRSPVGADAEAWRTYNDFLAGYHMLELLKQQTPAAPAPGLVKALDDPYGPSSVFPPSNPYPRPGGPWQPQQDNAGIEYVFRKEMANSDKIFYYSNQHFVDTSVTAAVKAYLTDKPGTQADKPHVVDLPKVTVAVGADASADKPVSSGIVVKEGEQYVLQSAFTLTVESYYNDYASQPFPWSSSWEGPDGDLFYRVGDGPWAPVGGRALIESDNLYKGEIQFRLDRAKIWSRIGKDYRERTMHGFKRAIFTYSRTYPSFDVSITGRKLDLGGKVELGSK